MDRTLTPKQAAERARCGRTTIMRALKEGSLYAVRDNQNRWKINPNDLDKWSDKRPEDSDRTVTSGHLRTDPKIAAKLATAETRAAMLADQLEDTRQDRDAWRAQAIKLASHADARPPVGILWRIFGRG